jgi:DNA-binding response OmpR family regulator
MPNRILLVAHDFDIGLALGDRLRSMGFEVVIENNEHSALSRIASEAPRSAIQGVLLDLQMPALDGAAVLRKLRDCHPDIPVIVMSAPGDTVQFDEAFKLGARSYFVKPFVRRQDWEQLYWLFHTPWSSR